MFDQKKRPAESIRIPRLFGLVRCSLNRTFVIHRPRLWKSTHPGIALRRIAGVDITRTQTVRRRLLIGAGSLLITVGSLAGCSTNAESAATAPTSTASVPAGPVINLSSLMFNPPTTTVKVGTTVTWRNDEPITHTVTSGRFQGVDKTTGLRSSQDPDGTIQRQAGGKRQNLQLHLHQTRQLHLLLRHSPGHERHDHGCRRHHIQRERPTVGTNSAAFTSSAQLRASREVHHE